MKMYCIFQNARAAIFRDLKLKLMFVWYFVLNPEFFYKLIAGKVYYRFKIVPNYICW